jgi:GDPmannose 4,6-dehydratase
MWLMLQQEKPCDYVIATGVTHSVRELLEIAFGSVSLDYLNYVEVDPLHLRPAEVHHLRGDYSKAERELGWKPRVSFEGLITMMVGEDLSRLRNASTAPFKMETAP